MPFMMGSRQSQFSMMGQNSSLSQFQTQSQTQPSLTGDSRRSLKDIIEFSVGVELKSYLQEMISNFTKVLSIKDDNDDSNIIKKVRKELKTINKLKKERSEIIKETLNHISSLINNQANEYLIAENAINEFLNNKEGVEIDLGHIAANYKSRTMRRFERNRRPNSLKKCVNKIISKVNSEL